MNMMLDDSKQQYKTNRQTPLNLAGNLLASKRPGRPGKQGVNHKVLHEPKIVRNADERIIKDDNRYILISD